MAEARLSDDQPDLYFKSPECPECKADHNTFCLECGEDAHGCTCPQPIDWYCGSCGNDWMFDPFEGEEIYEGELLDDIDAEINEELGEVGNVGCTCKPTMQFYCGKCGVVRSTTNEPWRLIPDTKGKTVTKTQKNKYGSGYDWDADWKSGGTTNWYGKDRHYNGDGLRMPTSGIWINASSHDDKRKAGQFVPDWGLYLDWCWKPDWRHEHIHWPDMSTPSNDIAAIEAILEAYERALDGLDIEIGCIGGHGRTGTVLGCMLTIEGVAPETAIKTVRGDYCQHAIESDTQEWWIHYFSHTLFGTPLPKKPEKKSYGGYTKGSKMCQPSDHYIMKMEGKVCNKGDKGQPCTWWAKDQANLEHPTEQMKRAWEQHNAKKKATSKSTSGGKSGGKSTVIDGFVVPKPKRGHKEHNPEAKRGCHCDVCRYQAKGFGALLEPVDQEEKKEQVIKVAQPNGHIMEVTVAETFDPMPPKSSVKGATELVAPGTVRGEYVYVKGEGWVWEGIAQVPKKKLGIKKSKKGKK